MKNDDQSPPSAAEATLSPAAATPGSGAVAPAATDEPESSAAAEAREAGAAAGARRRAADESLPTPRRALRTLYWALWFGVVPFALACVLVWALTPASGVEREGIFGWLAEHVRDQPVPFGIVTFTLFEMALWTVRHHLPLAYHAHPPLRDGLPRRMRAPFEKARALIEEAEAIFNKHEKAITEDLSSNERQSLRADLDALDEAMHEVPFDEEAFLDALVRADGEVDTKLGRWRKSELREYTESIVIAIMVAMALRAFVVEAFKIPSGSMIPTLQVGDHIFVNKFTYGPAIPWTQSRLWTDMPPKRGDVIVFSYPEHPEQDFIKRVIAIPGDKLEVRGGHPIINGWEVPSCRAGTYTYAETQGGYTHEGELFVEFLGDEAYLTLYDRQSLQNEYQGPFYVKPGEVFVMGDNRHNSHDSRMWFGNTGGGVPFANIKGRALFVWLSVSEKIDWSRMFAPVMGRPPSHGPLPGMAPAMKALEPAIETCLRERPPLEQTQPPPSGGRVR